MHVFLPVHKLDILLVPFFRVYGKHLLLKLQKLLHSKVPENGEQNEHQKSKGRQYRPFTDDFGELVGVEKHVG